MGIFRFIMAFITMSTSIVSLIALFAPKCCNKTYCSTNWFALYWLDWFCFVMMFVVFVLDCDSINTGMRSCKKGFKVEDTDTILYIDDGSSIAVEKCYIVPFIWMPLLDLATSIMVYCAYKVSSYYILDETARKQSVASPTKSTVTPSSVASNRSPSVGGVHQTQHVQQQQQQRRNTAGAQKKEDSPNPFEEYQGSYEVTTEQKPAQHIDMFNAYDEN